MLGTVLIVLTCVSGIVSVYGPYQEQNNGYQQPYGYGKNNIQKDIKQLSAGVDDTSIKFAAISKQTVALITADAKNTEFRDDFADNDFLDARKRQAKQSQDIVDLFKQIKSQVPLVVNVTALNSTLEEVYRQAIQLDRETVQLENVAKSLNNIDAQQEKRVSELRYLLGVQEKRLAQLENATRETQEDLKRTNQLFDNITQIQDTEQAEIYKVVLTKDNPTFTQVVDGDFRNVSPLVFSGISNFRVEDETQSYDLPTNYVNKGYNGYAASLGNVTIKFDIDVRYDPESNTLVVTLLDAGRGFTVSTITVNVLLINITNRDLSTKTAYY